MVQWRRIEYRSRKARRGSKRPLAALLAFSMLSGAFAPAAHAAAVGEWPLKMVTNVVDSTVDPVVPDGTGEAPTVTIEVNGVIDQARKLTGFVEVAIRVKPGVLHLAADGTIVSSTMDPNYDHSEVQPFSSLAVALEYSDKLTPWEWERVDGNWNRLDDAEPSNQTTAVDISSAIGAGFSARKMVEVDPLHQSTRIAHAAISPKGTVADGGTGDDGSALPPTVTLTGGGYLYLMAESFTAKDFNEEDTVLAVVRFKYDIDETNENNNPWGTMFSKGLNNPAVTDWIDPNSPNCLVKLTDADTLNDVIDPIIDWELIYDSGKSAARPDGNGMYYSTDDENGREAYDTSKPATDPDYISTTSNLMEVATVDTATPSTTTVVPGKVNYTLVNKLSYNFSSGDSAVILYYDWDDRHIGTQVLDPGDAREAVNEYVEKNFIHPDLRYSVHKGDANSVDYTDSLLRENTYRGEYPYDAPVAIPDVTSPTYEADLAAYQAQIAGTVAADGADYPLTNKLDYVFYKRYTEMSQTVTDPDGVPDSGDETAAAAQTLVDPDGVPDSGDEYYHVDGYAAKLLGNLTAADVEEPGLLDLPYIYGWAVVDDLDGISDVWTTLGTAEHTPYSGMDASQTPVDTTVDTTYGATGECLQFADFSDLKKGQVVRVKAVYEPGAELRNNELYTAITPPTYERYGQTDTSQGGVYAISFTFARVNADGKGVSRMRDPSIRIDYTPDVEGVGQKPFSVGIDLENRDILPVTYTPSSGLMSMEYSLRDKTLYDATRLAQPTMVGYNFYTGSERSTHSNLYNIDDNFNYEEHPYSQHLGSMGFVTKATFNQLAKLCREAAETGVMADVNTYINVAMLHDLNFKASVAADGTTTEYIALQATQFRAKLVDAYRIANGADLDWHQVQYHLLNSTYSGGVVSGGLTNNGGVISPAANTLAYNWCRLDNCSGGSSPINTWSDLMKAAADYVFTPNTNALNQLQDVFYLRKGITAQPFADKDEMKTKLIAVVTDLQTNGFTQTQVEALSWRQIQYLMDVGAAGITPANLPVNSDIAPTGSTKKDYWWENGGAKTISTWQELLEIQYHIINDNWFAGDDDNSGWRSGYTSPTTPLTGSVRDKDSDGNWKPTTDPNPFTTKSVSLRKDAAGAAFANITQFDTALSMAISTLTGEAAYQGGSFANVSLMEIQHALLGNAYRTESDLMDDTVAGTINYWWITGASTPKNLKELVTLVKQVVDGAPEDLLDNVTVELVSKAPFWLRADDAGTTFSSDSDLHDALLYAVEEWCNAGNDPATAPWPDTTNTNWSNAATRQVWSQLQNLLLGNPYNGDPDPGPTYAFWWYGDGHKPITNLEELLEAAWNSWGGPGGTAPSDSSDPNAMDTLTEADLGFITGTSVEEGGDPADYVYFRKNTNGDAFDSMADFKTALKAALQKITNRDGTLDYTKGQNWIVVQHLLLGNNYRSETQLRNDGSIDYWWENGGSKSGPTADYTWANQVVGELTQLASRVFNESNYTTPATANDILPHITDTMARALNLWSDTTGNGGHQLSKEEIAQLIVDAEGDAWNGNWQNTQIGGAAGDEICLSWKALQYWVLTGGLSGGTQETEANIDSGNLLTSAGCDWAPLENDTKAVQYTTADAYVSALTSKASRIFNESGYTIYPTASDIEPFITQDDVVGLNLWSDTPINGGHQLNKSEIAQTIIDAEADAWNGDWQNICIGGNAGDEICLDWKSLQNWLITGGSGAGAQLNLSASDYDAMSAMGIDWYPPNDLTTPNTASVLSLRVPLKAPALKPVEESETTDVVTSEDGLRTTTTKTVTTTDFKAGTVEIRKEIETVLTVGDKLVTTTDVYVTTVNMNTGEVTEAPAELGTPVITDAADIGTPELPEETETPGETEKPEETEPPAETEKPEETEPPAETEKPEETEPPAETEKPEETEPPAETEQPEEAEPPAETENPEETEKPAEPEDKESPDGAGEPAEDKKEPGSNETEEPSAEQESAEKMETEEEEAMTTAVTGVNASQPFYPIATRQRARRLRWRTDSPPTMIAWENEGASPQLWRLPLPRIFSISQRDILTIGRTRK
ncbi:hypothetical protein [Vermiculatibacterium agrestimuris]|uniref:hypothetical protein n=1 Tax=Vermiculatibacterium agrestimuris TaxID=2941519 RepID=UPI00203E880E|nr:hypothetical protein [Vermiculatibacterium agrestimuris]